MINVTNDFKTMTKKVKQQNIKLQINDGELTVREVHFMPVKVFNAIPLNRLKAKKKVIAKELVYSFEGQLFKTIMKQIEVTIKNAQEIKEKDVNFRYGLYINSNFEYVDLGNFFIKDIEDSKSKNEIVATGYDRMIRFMKTFKQSELQLIYPCTVLDLVQKICEICGVELYSTDFFNADLEVTEDFFTAQELTYRDVLERVTQATLTTAFIKENKLYFCAVSDEVVQRLDKSYISDLVIKEKFGPVNALVIGRGSVEDNVEARDDENIATNGRCEIRFDENELIEYQREEVIDSMFEQVSGLEYYSFEGSDLGVTWLEPCDCIELGDREDNFYKSYYLKANIKITTGISSDIGADLIDETNTEYKVTTKEEKKNLKVERLAKKNEGLIQDIIKEQTETSEKLTQHEQTIDGIVTTVSETKTELAKDIHNNYQEIIQKFDSTVQEDDLVAIRNQVQTIQNNSEYAINIAEEMQLNGVSKVKTEVGYTFDSNGLTIEKNNAETKSKLNETGLEIMDATGSSDEVLLKAGYDSETGETIVKSKNMAVEKYLCIGTNSRIEDFEDGTAIFYTGGVS